MGGFFLLLGRARSYPPSGRKTPDTARAFFGLSAPQRKDLSSASLPRARIPKRSSGPFRGPRRAGGAACRGGRSFFSLSLLLLCPFLPRLLQSPCGRNDAMCSAHARSAHHEAKPRIMPVERIMFRGGGTHHPPSALKTLGGWSFSPFARPPFSAFSPPRRSDALRTAPKSKNCPVFSPFLPCFLFFV